MFTFKISDFLANYELFCDHYVVSGEMEAFRILDNTTYPYTKDPFHQYAKEEASMSKSNQILGIEGDKNQKAFTFCTTLYNNPLDQTCPL